MGPHNRRMSAFDLINSRMRFWLWCLLWTQLVGLVAAAPPWERIERRERHMGTQFTALVYTQ